MKEVFSSLTKKTITWLATGALGFAGLTAGAHAAVKEQTVKAANGLNLETLVVYPDNGQTEALPVVLMDHGFLLNKSYYHEVLVEIAEQGFVVVAPQAYASGGLPFGKPTTIVEAQNVAKAFAWFQTNLSGLIQHPVDFTHVGLVNHSRGSKVAVTLLRDKLVDAQALAAIDPVDGTADGSPRITGPAGAKITVPTLIIGTGLGSKKTLGQACAPADLNYDQFWAAVSTTPAWLFVAQDYGHMDLLDSPNKCGLICSVCSKATAANPTEDYRVWVGSTVGDFLRAILYKDSAALDRLNAADQGSITASKKSN